MGPRRATKPAAKPAAKPEDDVGSKRKRRASEAPAKRKAPAEAPPPREVKRRVAHEKEELQPVSHPSHQHAPGHVFLFGDGDCGQLGMGEEVTERLRPFPLALPGAPRALQLALGGMHSAALAEGGRRIFTWGVNDEGALGRETAGELWERSGRGSGKPGDSYTPGEVALPPEAGSLVQISAGDSHTCVLTERGADHVAAVTRGGGLLTWGNGQQGQLGRVGERLSDRVKLATLLQPGAVPFKRARGVSTRIADVNCGTYATFALTADGHVFAFGLNNYGQLALPSQARPWRRSWGSQYLRGRGAPVFAPTLVKSLEGKGVAAVRSGQHHTLVLTRQGRLLSFGRPTYGRLGQRDADVAADAACPEPKPVDGLGDVEVAGAAAGLAVSGAVSAAGAAWLWGFGTSNQLGKGDDDEDEVVPRKLAETKKFSGQKVLQLEFGGQHAGLLCAPAGAGAPAPAAEEAEEEGEEGEGEDGAGEGSEEEEEGGSEGPANGEAA
eukprot:scaffold17.g575.t1